MSTNSRLINKTTINRLKLFTPCVIQCLYTFLKHSQDKCLNYKKMPPTCLPILCFKQIIYATFIDFFAVDKVYFCFEKKTLTYLVANVIMISYMLELEILTSIYILS